MTDDPKLNVRQLKVLDSMRSAIKLPPVPSRSCGDCAKCCEGWLEGAAHGHAFFPGNPCFFLEKTCSIYEERPVNPCRTFQCSWLSENTFPMWMKPSLSNIIIITKREGEAHGPSHYLARLAGETFDRRALRWLETWAATTGVNIEFRLDGETRRIGSPSFVGG